MKWLLGALFLFMAVLVLWGTLPGIRPVERNWQVGGERPILPMSFAHGDHRTVQCATCHHNFNDPKMRGRACIDCHVRDTSVSHLLEQQFHTLCRSCHVNERSVRKAFGPTRQCVACHTVDGEF